MQGRGTIDTVAKAIHIHPTLNEIVKSAGQGRAVEGGWAA